MTQLYKKLSDYIKVLVKATSDDELLKYLTPKKVPEKPVYKNWFRKELEAKRRLHSQ